MLRLPLTLSPNRDDTISSPFVPGEAHHPLKIHHSSNSCRCHSRKILVLIKCVFVADLEREVGRHLHIGEFGRGQRLNEGAESGRRKEAEQRKNFHNAHSIPQNQAQWEKFTEIHKYCELLSKPYPKRPRLVAGTSLQILSVIGSPQNQAEAFKQGQAPCASMNST